MKKGFRHSEETKQKIRLARLGRKHTEETKKKISKTECGKFVSVETKQKISMIRLGWKHSNETKRKLSKMFSGERSSFWRGGVSNRNKRIKRSLKFRLWREEVFKRDNYACQFCGNKSSKDNKVYLHPHHIKSFSDYPNLRFRVSNGITLCERCHKLTKNFGARIKKTIIFTQLNLIENPIKIETKEFNFASWSDVR